MWIYMKHTYAGGVGTFLRDQKYDLPPDIVRHIPKDCYKKTCPPWDEQIDRPAVALTNARAAAQVAADEVARLEREIDSAKTNIEQLGHQVKVKTSQLDRAKADAERLANIAKQKVDKIAKAEAKAKAKTEAEAKAKAEAEQSQESENAGQEKEQTETGQPEGDNSQSEGQAVSA